MKRNKRVFTVFLLLATGFLGGGTSGFLLNTTATAQYDRPKTLEADSVITGDIKIVNRRGEVVAALYASDEHDGAALFLSEGNSAGDQSIYLNVDGRTGDTGLSIKGRRGSINTFFLNGEPQIVVKDGNKNTRILIGLERGNPHVIIVDERGNAVWAEP